MALPRMSGYISARKLSKEHSLANNREETHSNNSQVEMKIIIKFRETLFFMFQDINNIDSYNIHNSNISIAEILKRNEYVIPRLSSPTPEQIINVGHFGR